MKKGKIIEFIRRIELFKGLEESDLQQLAENIEEKSYSEGSFLFMENEPRENIYIIYTGEVKLCKTTFTGIRKELAFFSAGDFLGEGSLNENSPHSTSARVSVPANILYIKKEFFKQYGETSIKVFSNIARVISRRMRHANNRLVNRAAQYESGKTRLEHDLLGEREVPYEYCHPNTHINLSQSTNDTYPTAVKIALIKSNVALIDVLKKLIKSFRGKACEFEFVIKMGRTQLQDAVPMTLGQEFEAYAVTLDEEIQRLEENANLFLEVNMGGTAIGTGINAKPGYSDKVISHLRAITGLKVKNAKNLVEATQDTGAFVMYSSAIKRLAIKLSKISNDLRLLSSGPRAGFNEINLPPMQPGSRV